jgi:hypothetical protein
VTKDDRVAVRIEGQTRAFLESRARRFGDAGVGTQARAELELWESAMAAELVRVRLTLPQASCLADVILMSPAVAVIDPLDSGNLVGALWVGCYDAFRRTPPGESSLAGRWNIDEQALLDYLRTLGPTADHALYDALSRWRDMNLDETVDGFARVGLRVTG